MRGRASSPPRSLRVLLAPVALLAAGACATRSDIQILQNDLRVMRIESAQADSMRRVQVDAAIAAMARVQDTLRVMHAQTAKFQGDVRGELYALGQQVIQVQELSGQSQRRLQELRASLEQRSQEMQAPPNVAPGRSAPAPTTTAPATQRPETPAAQTPTQSAGATPTTTPSTAGAAPAAQPQAPPGPGPNQLFQLALDQLRRGSAVAARAGFQDLLRQYPTADVAPEAQFYIGQSYETEGSIAQADSAYATVVSRYPQSTRAPTALYKRALALQQQGKVQAARAALDRVIRDYPRSDEAVLARDRLRTLR